MPVLNYNLWFFTDIFVDNIVLGDYRYFCASAVGIGVIYCKTSNVNMAWKFSDDDIDFSKFMAEPVTDLAHLKENKSDMKTKVELMILRIQVSHDSYHIWLF